MSDAGKYTKQISFKKTSCYFCNDWLENSDIEDHIIHCGQVLQKCQNDCGVYVTRKEMDKHLNKCPSGFGEVIGTDDNKFISLEQELTALRFALNEEIRQRLHLITDIGMLKKRSLLADEWTKKVGDVLNALQKCLNEETKNRTSEIAKSNVEVNNLMQQYQSTENWRLELTMRFNQIGNKMNQKFLESTDNSLSKLRSELEGLKLHYLGEPKINSQELDRKLSAIDLVLEDYHQTIGNIIGQVNKFRAEFEEIQTKYEDFHEKQIKMDYEAKSMQHIVHETEDKCEKLDKNVAEYRRDIYRVKQDLNDLETHLKHQKKLYSIQNTRGHLIWRIDDFENKLKDAKENDTLLKSPLFCNKQYGYTLRVDVSLNGIGTWRGRNMILCLTVVDGDNDSLLEWPCIMNATVTLKDQPVDIKQANDYTKTILVRRKNQEFEKSQYIHIPHKTLKGGQFIKNDTIFLEVRMLK